MPQGLVCNLQIIIKKTQQNIDALQKYSLADQPTMG
jgi:hypothetical protein